MRTITVNAEVDIDDVLYEASDNDLQRELRRRKVKQEDVSNFKTSEQLKNYICSLLGLHEWNYSDKERALKEFGELF